MKYRPSVPVIITNPDTGASIVAKAQIDTGAAMTVICSDTAAKLKLEPLRKSAPILRVNSKPLRPHVFAVHLASCADNKPVSIEAVGFDLRPFHDGCSMLIGADMIDSLHIANGRLHSYELSRKQPRVRS